MSPVRFIVVALICAVTIGFLLAGLATVGILVPAGWWPVLVVASAAASAVLLSLFFSPSLVLGMAIDIDLLRIVLATVGSNHHRVHRVGGSRLTYRLESLAGEGVAQPAACATRSGGERRRTCR